MTTEYPPVIYGGLGTAVGGWVKASAKAGLDVGVLLVEGALVVDDDAPVRYGAPNPVGAQPTAVDREGVAFFWADWQTAPEVAVDLVRRWRADVVHLHTAMLWEGARAVIDRTNAPVVYHLHSVDRAEYEIGREPNQWLAHSIAQEEAIAAAHRLIALTHAERELVEAYYPHAAGRVRVIGNGIDDAANARRSVVRPRPTEPVTVLYSGRLVERKGIREMLDALPRVFEDAPNARVVVAGGPPSISPELLSREWLTEVHAGYGDRIRFTGWLTPSALAREYAEADILVVPSRYEPFGMVVLEGMLYGLAVAAACVGGPAEIIEDGRTGLHFPPNDADAIALTLARLATDHRLRRSLGIAAARAVRQRWRWRWLVEMMRDVYHEVA